MIKAVLFDFYGVLCSDEYWNFVNADRNTTGKFRQLADDVNLGRLGWNELLQKVAAETGKSVDQVRDMYKSERINPALLTYAEKLHRNYKTAILSNASSEFFRPMAEEAGLVKIFDEIIVSSELGIIKPDPRIFEYALNKLEVKPSEAVFIDDLVAHVEAAARLGLHAILYKSFPRLKTELERLLKAISDN